VHRPPAHRGTAVGQSRRASVSRDHRSLNCKWHCQFTQVVDRESASKWPTYDVLGDTYWKSSFQFYS
jgi:hypothetical protein